MRRTVGRSSHDVEPIAVFAVIAAAADHLSSAVDGVSVIETEVVAHFMGEDVHRDVVFAIDPHIPATDRGQSPPGAATCVARHQVNEMRIVRQVVTSGLRGGQSIGFDGASVAIGAGDWNREPAGNVSREPGLLEGVL